MRQKLYLILLFACSILFVACDKDNSPEAKDIQLNGETPNEVALTKLSTRMFLLTGGTGKYIAYVADSKVAGVNISKDTLRVNGIWEGTTYATIISGDKRQRIDIHVVAPEISISQSEIRLFPRDESKFVSLNGGGDIVDLKVDDPDKVMSVKWNAKTNILEIQAHYEGEAKIRVISPRVGDYGTTSHSLYAQMNTVMAVRRPGVGVWLCNGARPYSSKKVVKITPAIVNPVVGTRIPVSLSMLYPDEFSSSGLKEGAQQLYVEEVREKDVVLRGRGYKFVIPYEKR